MSRIVVERIEKRDRRLGTVAEQRRHLEQRDRAVAVAVEQGARRGRDRTAPAAGCRARRAPGGSGPAPIRSCPPPASRRSTGTCPGPAGCCRRRSADARRRGPRHRGRRRRTTSRDRSRRACRGKAALSPRLSTRSRFTSADGGEARRRSISSKSGPSASSAKRQPVVVAPGSFTSTVNRPARRDGAVGSSWPAAAGSRSGRSRSRPGMVTSRSTVSSGSRVAGAVLGGGVEVDAVRAAHAEAHQEIPAEPHVHVAVDVQAQRRQPDVEVDRQRQQRQILAEMHVERDVVGRGDDLDVVEVHDRVGIGTVLEQVQTRRTEDLEQRLLHGVVASC